MSKPLTLLAALLLLPPARSVAGVRAVKNSLVIKPRK